MNRKICALILAILALCAAPYGALGENAPALAFQANRITLVAGARAPVVVNASAACEHDIRFEYRYMDIVAQAVLPAGKTSLALVLETPAVTNQAHIQLEILPGEGYALGKHAMAQLNIIETLEFEVYGRDYVFARAGAEISASFLLKTTKYISEGADFEFRDEYGTVLASKKFSKGASQQSFRFAVPEDWTGVRLAAVWMGDRKLSKDFQIIINSGASPIYQVETDEPKLAICINCGSGSEQDAHRWLDLLDEYNAKASFFLVGNWAAHYPDLLNEILERGHELGNHTMSHIRIPYATPDELKTDVERADKLIAEATNGYNSMLFSAPYGSWDSRVVSLLNYWGYTTVQWSVDSGDSIETYSTSRIYERSTCDDIGPGGIVLFHVNSKYFDIMDDVFDYYTRTLGLELVRVTDLLPKGDYTVDASGVARAAE